MDLVSLDDVRLVRRSSGSSFVWFVVRLVRRSSGSVDPSRPKKFLGAIAPKKILNLFSGSVDQGSVDPARPKISPKISPKTSPKTSPTRGVGWPGG